MTLDETNSDLQPSGLAQLTAAIEPRPGRPAPVQFKLEGIIDNIPDPIFILDREKRVVAWNHACETLTGVKRGDILGQGDYAYAQAFVGQRIPIVVDLLDQELPDTEARYRNIQRKEGAITAEAYMPELHGRREVYLWIEAVALVDARGQRYGAIELIKDISAQKKLENSMRASEIKYRALFEFAPDAILLLQDGHFMECNSRALEVYGCSREAILGTSPADFSPPVQPDGSPSPDKAQEWIARALSQGHLDFEWQHVRRDGSLFMAEVSLTRLEIAGQLLVQAIVRDVSERKRVEEELRHSSLYLSSIIENIPFMVFMKDARDLRFTLFNREGERLLGISRAELLGKNDYDFFPREQAEFFTENDRQVLNGNQIIDIAEEPLLTRDKGERILHTRKVPVFNEAGQPEYLLGISEDITERKRTQEEIKAMLAVSERSRRALLSTLEDRREAERKLKAAVAELERSNRELEQFAYVASHDLQEPLRMVSNYTQLLAQYLGDKLDDRIRMCIRFAVDGATRMQKLIEDLLAYSRVGSRARPAGRTDANAALSLALKNLAASIEESKAQITCASLPDVQADEQLLAQVFQNLIANAIKFKGPELPRIHISCRDEEGGWSFSVKDNGIGIDSKHAERIFAIFQRLHTREEYPGTGIGLAICKRIIERFGGRIWMESSTGAGADFRFTLPKA